MSSKLPHRYDVIDREFPVRLVIEARPETYEITRQWLQRNVGTGNYASKPHLLWNTRATAVYFRNLHEALMFVAGCPHVKLAWEGYSGKVR
ncbi:hypothetical protein C8N31_107102 [Sulfitobacter mediterraneus]|uniref:Uncharacterized protein n=1 Tax=Sulfitobacter mediterraneus TaxID=83219 RepID=A0A2T6CD45_9RHOB|nr:hypothetical protein C8N31_107102 [Sulfitobacter mediterraneus]